jgi:hypothetical protein
MENLAYKKDANPTFVIHVQPLRPRRRSPSLVLTLVVIAVTLVCILGMSGGNPRPTTDMQLIRCSVSRLLAAFAVLNQCEVFAEPVPYAVKRPPLDTPWTFNVGTNPWPQHPRPQLQRDAWQSLNGIWNYQRANGNDDLSSPPAAGTLANEIMIPSCVESGLSGIMDTTVTHMWFETMFKVPADWEGQSILLNFEAVDYEATVFLNGANVGFHRGGYFRFTIDATDHIDIGGENRL